MAKDLDENYRQAGFGRSLGQGVKACVLMVDFVRAYTDPASPLFADVDAARLACATLLARARAAHVMIVHTNVQYEPGGLDGGWFYRKVPALRVFERGSPFGAFADGVEPAAGEIVITKQYPSAFFATSLAPTLHMMGVDTVLICGLSTSGCVRASAVDAMQHGFRTIVVSDCVADRDPRPHAANLFDLAAKYADVIPSADICEIP